ncbi:MAG: radical SAM protein [Brevinematales bacterium]
MFVSSPAYNNAIANLHECRKRSAKIKSYPLKLYLEPNTNCNLDCTYCYPREWRVNKTMTMELFEAIEKQLFGYCSEVNLFLRGEPTLAQNFPEMLDICAQYPMITKFFSNLSYNNDKILRKMVECGVWLNLSFDGIEETEKLRKGINIDQVIRNMKFLQDYQKEINSKKFHLRLAVVVSKLNVRNLTNIIEWADSMKIREVMFGCLDAFHMKFKDAVTVEDVPIFEKAVKTADKLNIRVSTPSHIGGKKLEKSSNWNDFKLDIDDYFPHYCEDSNPDVDKRFCPYPWLEAVIQADGEVVSCCQRKIHMGWMTPKTDFIKEIWNNKAYNKLRSMKDFSKCKNSDGHPCGLATYSIWGGENRLNNIPKSQK